MRLHLRAGLVLGAALAACSPDARVEEKAGHVTAATLADGKADAVFGQKDLNSAGAPVKVTSLTVNRPQGLAMHRADPGILAIADTGASRAFEVTEPLFGFTSFLQGQVDFTTGLPNQGRATPLFVTLSGPTAIAKHGNLTAIADGGNHRVILDWSFGVPHDVLGQSGSGGTGIPNRFGVGPDSLDSPRGVAFLQQGQLYLFVADTGNHRLLGYDVNAVGKALFVIGQGSFTTNVANKGAGPDADRLSSPRGIAALSDDSTGAPPPEVGIYVADTANHRVLHFGWCTSFERGSGPCLDADRVWGQPDFVSAAPGVGPDRLDTPTAVAVDRNRGIWVADTGNHRVLHFQRKATRADVVLGQPDFTTHDAPIATSATTLNAPSGLAVSEASGDLYVADEADSRILRYAFVATPDACDDGDPCTIDTIVPGKGCGHQATPNSPDCFPFACDLSTRTCATDCAALGCQAPYVCVSTGAGFTGGRCEQPCATSAGCRKGACADGWCCESACGGVCESCNQPGNEGRCVPIAGDPATFKLASCAATAHDADCAGACDGRATDRCAPSAPGTPCGVVACVDGVQSGGASCDGAGTCVQVSTRCFPYACDAARCRTACFGDRHCADGARCIDGACVEAGKALVAGGGCAVGGAGEATSLALPIALATAFAARRRRTPRRARARVR